MIDYPTGSWETDLKIPGSFIRDYSELVENILDIDAPIRFFKNERYYILWEYAKSVADLDGDFVECGVFNGNSAFFMAKQCKTHLHLFESFQGVSDFTEYDNDFYIENKFIGTPEAVNKALESFNNFTLHTGKVPFEFDQVTKISLLHVDLNNYNPTKTTLEALWDKVVPGGVVVVDIHDGFATGADKATVEFFAGKELSTLATGKLVVIK